MIKKQPYGKTSKEQHLASAKDRLYCFLMADGAFRGAILHATRMVNEMRVIMNLEYWKPWCWAMHKSAQVCSG